MFNQAINSVSFNNIKMINNTLVNQPQIEVDIKPGIHDITNDLYHSSEGISRTQLMQFNITPYHYWSHYINPNRPPKKEESSSMSFGNLIHTLILEPQLFNDRYIVIKKMDRRTKAGMSYYSTIDNIKGSRKVITEEDYSLSKSVVETIMKNNMVNDLIQGAQYEKSFYWNDPHTGLLCKSRPDIWHENFIVDIKTASSANYREFQKSLYLYGYHIQSAMIHEALKSICDIIMRDFIFIVIEKEYPYAHAIYKLDELSLEKGISIFKNKLLELKQCYEKDEWPCYKTQIINLPNYADGE